MFPESSMVQDFSLDIYDYRSVRGRTEQDVLPEEELEESQGL